MIYDKHVFVCVNQRAPESPRKSCGEAHGLRLVDSIKKELKSRNITGKLRVQRTGCLDICDFGPTLVIYPQGTFYVGVTEADVPELVEKEFVLNERLERLVLRQK
jgi:(2Fe-2S) ferredoxin